MTATDISTRAPAAPDLTQGPIAPTLIRLALPSIFAMFVQAAMVVTDAYFLGQLGRDVLAGAALVFPMLMLMSMLSAGAIGGSVAGAIARAVGAGDLGRAEAILRHALVVAAATAALFGGIFLLFGRDIFTVFGGSGQALDHAVAYADLLFAGIFSVWLFNILGSVVRGTGRMGVSAAAIFLVTAVQVPLAGLLILGAGPFPALGIEGAAIATVAAYGIGALWLLIDLWRGRGPLRLQWRGGLSAGLFAETLRTGALGAMNPILTVAVVAIANAFIGRMGTSALAGYGIGARLEFLMVPVIFGIGAALITMVGANVGAGRRDRAIRIAWTGAFAAGAITGAIGLAAALAPGWWADSFTTDPTVAEACRRYLQTVGPFYALFGLGLALYFASHGLRSMRWPVLGGVFRLTIIAAGCGWLAGTGAMTFDALLLVVAVGMVSFGLFNALSLHRFAWRATPNQNLGTS
ncbi:MAG: MATE family efflux transporter [Rhodospirillaceae bacterium]|nr:MATE family efflux transporter [Rhodospirillaceae bacterium]